MTMKILLFLLVVFKGAQCRKLMCGFGAGDSAKPNPFCPCPMSDLYYDDGECRFIRDKCKEVVCVKGNCYNTYNAFFCDCFPGYRGKYCDEQMDLDTPKPLRAPFAYYHIFPNCIEDTFWLFLKEPGDEFLAEVSVGNKTLLLNWNHFRKPKWSTRNMCYIDYYDTKEMQMDPPVDVDSCRFYPEAKLPGFKMTFQGHKLEGRYPHKYINVKMYNGDDLNFYHKFHIYC